MVNRDHLLFDRRLFVKFLLSSPLFSTGLISCSTENAEIQLTEDAFLISSPDDAINIFDLKNVAENKLSLPHYAYLQTGVDDNVTVKANQEGYKKLSIRSRRLVNMSKINTDVELFGNKWRSPIILAPVASQRGFHPQGEIAVAKAAKNKDHLLILSTLATSPIEDVANESGKPVWFQLYPATKWEITSTMLKRAEDAGCPVVVVTVDLAIGRGGNREFYYQAKRNSSIKCGKCHKGYYKNKPMVSDQDYQRMASLTWDDIQKIKQLTKMKVVLKGIVTAEDARLCLQNGIDGIIVSNHGGRAEESGRATIDCLPEVVQAVNQRIPVLMDGGIRRGTDIFKALALGADAICIGRPYLWGLAAFGQAGVEKVLEILHAELVRIMRQAGVQSIKSITRKYLDG